MIRIGWAIACDNKVVSESMYSSRQEAIGWFIGDMITWSGLKKNGYKTIPIYADPKDLSPGVPAPTKEK